MKLLLKPRTLNHETTENGVTADDDRKSRASGLANHRVVNEARSAQRDRMKIDAPYLEKSTVTLQLRPRSGVENEAEKRCLDRPIGEQPFFQVMPLSGPDNMHLGASLGGRPTFVENTRSATCGDHRYAKDFTFFSIFITYTGRFCV